MLKHVIELFADPKTAWYNIREADYSVLQCYTGHTLILALIPAVSGFIGTTQIGWQLGTGEPMKLSTVSAYRISFLYYLAMLAAVYTGGWMIHWMGKTYGAEQPVSRCVALASYTATPLFLIGVMELYPVLWLNLVVSLPVLAFTIYVFYSGVPIMMEIPPERGFLFASAVLGFGLIALVAMLAVTVILWGAGLEPTLTY